MSTRTPEQTSKIMSRIRGKDTKIELLLRKELWKRGLRYRKNYKKLPGTPDIVFIKQKIAIFCDGDFWHGKSKSDFSNLMGERAEYWKRKIEGNIARDKHTYDILDKNGWKVLRFRNSEIEKRLADVVNEIETVLFD